MEFSFKLLGILLVFLFVVISNVHSKPAEETALSGDQDEIMETAAGTNPFLPRFAMRKLKERREKARAQRRNGQQRPQPQTARRPDCPRNPYRRYYKK